MPSDDDRRPSAHDDPSRERRQTVHDDLVRERRPPSTAERFFPQAGADTHSLARELAGADDGWYTTEPPDDEYDGGPAEWEPPQDRPERPAAASAGTGGGPGRGRATRRPQEGAEGASGHAGWEGGATDPTAQERADGPAPRGGVTNPAPRQSAAGAAGPQGAAGATAPRRAAGSTPSQGTAGPTAPQGAAGPTSQDGAAGSDASGSGVTGPESPEGDGGASGPELARAVLDAALAKRREKARTPRRRTGAGEEGGRRPRGYSGPGPDPRDPQLFGAVLQRLMKSRGWERPKAEATVFGAWEKVVGPDIAKHSRPVKLDAGVLTVEAESTAWATQLRLLAATLLRSIAGEVGHNVVTRLNIHGPAAPSWNRGPRRVQGRGPRDTYG